MPQIEHASSGRGILSVNEAAAYVGLSRRAVYKLMETEEFPPRVRLTPSGKRVGVRFEDLLRWIDTREAA